MRKHKIQFKLLLELSSVLEDIVHDKGVSMSINGQKVVETGTKVFHAERAATF